MVTVVLREISQKHEGLLRPADVVKEASDPNSPIHSWFEWDDGKAAEEYRLEQARKLIRVNMAYLSDAGKSVPYRVFVSLPSDRNPQGGYRETTVVLANQELRQEMLAEALRRFQALQVQYQDLIELQRIFDAINEASKIAV